MRLLTVTARTQGRRADDYCDGVEGELVWIPNPCGPALLQPDTPACNCHRIFGGVSSGGASTTALVIESDLSHREILGVMRGGAEVNEWPTTCAGHLAHEMLTVAERWPTGTVLERSYFAFRARPTS